MPYRVLDDFDHGILSPSGRESKRSRKAVLDKLGKTVNEAMAAAEAQNRADLEAKHPQYLRQYEAELRALADRGMRPKAHRTKAAELEAEADQIDLQRHKGANDTIAAGPGR